ncbi:crotonase/enoyl-CoA hydratase family protein [Tropicibacter naphthalenivorans]|uniref:Putative enoyl-CoA hydratase echA8 n=1 Tax=Tropicibacter naphthalenivorans TaxID=441103 RepID=A0A0N7LZC3_9RHOB|nr:crotonase/enoyl-CoA hydratase family protein [Tropicibacter naphthalenivorans]CUH77265.1 putative enoyl-CoA hydratase echA8 [Tropicibacter naphthalenivorans]SMC59407.1 Enoyl-CoA hydratase/carnithine racemase [Tropicibacter naphthalenivorans]
MSESVTITRANHVAEVTINRPAKRNAVDMSVFEGLATIGESLRDDHDIRAIILRGEGDHFCAGIDTGLFTSADPSDLFRRLIDLPCAHTHSNFFQKPCTIWQMLDTPVIAALQGVTFGAGLQIALGADIRIAAPDTRLSVMEIKWGLVPDMGLSTALPRLVRADIAKELTFTGRIVEANEAQQIGLVTRIADDPLAAAREMARTIAANNPEAIRRDKRLLNTAWTATRAEALRLEAELQSQVLGQPNQIEAVMAQMQNRTPEFT